MCACVCAWVVKGGLEMHKLKIMYLLVKINSSPQFLSDPLIKSDFLAEKESKRERERERDRVSTRHDYLWLHEREKKGDDKIGMQSNETK